MAMMDKFDERQLVRCLRCREMVARTDIGPDGVCHACKTRYKKTRWETSEERRLERAEREKQVQSTRVTCPVCGLEHIMIEDKKRCKCGLTLRKKMTESLL